MITQTPTTTLQSLLPATGQERPVFLDETGRRARLVRVAGRLLVVATACWLAALLAGALTPLQLPSLRVQIAAAGSGLHASVAQRRLGGHTPVGQLAFTRLTVRPDVDSEITRSVAAASPERPIHRA